MNKTISETFLFHFTNNSITNTSTQQITDTGNDMDTAVAEIAELLRSLFLWKKTVLKENL